MPRVSVNSTFNNASRDISRLNSYVIDSHSLSAKYQHFISEVVFIRLFSILETSISEVGLKLASGSNYRNGNSPLILLNCRSINDAYSNMLSYNRRRSLRYLKWTNANFIKESIEHVLDISDLFYINVQNHGNIINEMRIVRNHIAHRTKSTRDQYITVLRRVYGGNPNLTVGAFLTSTTRHSRPNIDRYIITSNVILNDITQG